jgi:hypothetical protein
MATRVLHSACNSNDAQGKQPVARIGELLPHRWQPGTAYWSTTRTQGVITACLPGSIE